MPRIVVAGGCYFERCLSPSAFELFGSGGRAAAAMSSFSDVTLHTYFPEDREGDVHANFAVFGVETIVHASEAVVEFHYHFPLSPPRFAPIPLPHAEDVLVSGDTVVRFGCVEGSMVVNAKVAVYDPQSGHDPRPFKENGSRADRLALVLNKAELVRLCGLGAMEEQVARLTDSPDVVVVKCGAHGARVFEAGKEVGRVPVYRTKSVYKIGSGDIFTAMFAYFWGEQNLPAVEAANIASKYVAYYVSNRCTNLPDSPPELESWQPHKEPEKVYLAGSFFTSEHVWLVEETYGALISLGIPTFSPYHDVGLGTGKEIAAADLRGLHDCAILFALISDNDPGTLFEIGYAISLGKKVIAFSQNSRSQDHTMLLGTECEIHDDLATALYHTAWASMS